MRTFNRPFARIILVALVTSAAFLPLLVAPAAAQETPPTDAAPAKSETPKWETLKAAYEYEKTPQGKPLTVKEEARDDEKFEGQSFSQSHLTFTNGQGHTVTGLFLKPKGDGPYPIVLLLHGLNSDKETMVKAFGRYLLSKGVACLALDAALHGERQPVGQERITGPTFFQVMKETLVDWRLALDWVTTRKDINSNHIGLFGYSMGAMMGSILGPIDDRITAATLCVGGDPVLTSISSLPPRIRAIGEAVSPSLYIGHFTPRPLLMVNAKDDRVMAQEAAKRLQDAAKQTQNDPLGQKRPSPPRRRYPRRDGLAVGKGHR